MTPKRILLAILALFVLWLVAIAVPGISLASRATRLQEMTKNPAQLNIAAVASEVRGARGDFAVLRFAITPVVWLGARLGGDFGAGEPLMDAANESLIAADEGLVALAPDLGDLGPSNLSMNQLPRLMDALVAARPALADAETHLDAAAGSLQRVPSSLSPNVQRSVDQVSKYVEFARYGIGIAQVAPDLLGRDTPRTYLVLIQNSDEIRPTGGFISNVGEVVLSHGTIISLTVQDSYAVDDFSKYYPDPPQPLLDYMGSEQWVFRDANWSPDFPTTARDAIWLYQISRPEKIDGVIALNIRSVQILMGGLEPLQVEGIPEPITAANAAQLFQDAWNPSSSDGKPFDAGTWIANRKQFVSAAMRAAMDKLLVGKANWSKLALGVAEALRQRQILIYVEGDAAREFRKLNLDGAVQRAGGDYLMIVDSNVGFAKVAPLIDQNVEYRVTLNPQGSGSAVANLNYVHRGTQTGIVCTPSVPYDATITYEKIINRCYYDYLRLLVPRGSQLVSATPHAAPGNYFWSGKPASGIAETLVEEGSGTAFGQLFVVEYGKTLQTRFEYALPVVVDAVGEMKTYTLLLQKQSGTEALPIRVLVTLPPSARFISAEPFPVAQDGGTLQFDLTLDTDRQVQVVYGLAP